MYDRMKDELAKKIIYDFLKEKDTIFTINDFLEWLYEKYNEGLYKMEVKMFGFSIRIWTKYLKKYCKVVGKRKSYNIYRGDI